MKSATKWILFFAVQVNKCHISRANFSRIVNYNWIVIAFSQSINLSKPFVSGCCYYDNAFNFHPNSSASLTLFLILDLRYDGYSQHLFTKLCFFFFVYGTHTFLKGFLMLIMMKEARLIFVNITEIVWGFTGGAGAKTVKYRLKWHNTRAQQWRGTAAW